MAFVYRILLVEARYYPDISDALLAGAEAELKARRLIWDRLEVAGALEIPGAITSVSGGKKFYHGYVALGCVIRGETAHYDIVAGESARGLMDLSTHRRLAIGNGILTCDTREQAQARADMKGGDKGGAAVRGCVGVIRAGRRITRGGDASPDDEDETR